ncbi:MAG: aminodeoxychorismate synthase component I [Pasteurellaceae bacterium]|nr:aminodeoxychorismate synthase component I [Pasteurellaceae bacterium]
MTLSQFIQQADNFGQKRQPFFFLIDFEQQKPVIFPIDQAEKAGIYFAINQQYNANPPISEPKSDFQLERYPMSLSDYQIGFNVVQQELQKGNSYLLNLTYPTEIKTNFNLAQIFQHTQARYKLYYRDQFVCFSPECFVKIDNSQITTYPMKGTINAKLPNAESVLLNDPKEMSEHYTIVDLMRNDLASVAKNIQVKTFRYVEKIQTANGAILQTSSEIVGQLDENWQNRIGQILTTLLPAGSISGAPKTKTVQIIQQAEQQPRGYYTGIFGLFTGESLDSAVAIRFIEQRQNKYYFRSGGGITRQSQCKSEYDELLQKVYVPILTPENQ